MRLIVRRCEAHARFPVGPLRQLQLSRLHHRPGGGRPGTGWPTIGATPTIENAMPRPEVRRGGSTISPRVASPVNGAWLASAGDRRSWHADDGAHRSGPADRDHQDPATLAADPIHGRKAHPPARRLTLHLPQRGWAVPPVRPWEPGRPSSVAPSLDSERCLSPPDGARPPLTRHPAN